MRSEVSKSTALGTEISSAMAEGRLVTDSVANELAAQTLNELHRNQTKVVILDGYPRTVNQAIFLVKTFPHIKFSAIHIMLERWVAIQKTLGRQSCKTCGGSFNSSDIRTDGFFMPAIVPNSVTCSRGELCNPVFLKRSDDTLELAEVRYSEFLTKTAPLLDWYGTRSILTNFEVKKGIADADSLQEIMNKLVAD